MSNILKTIIIGTSLSDTSDDVVLAGAAVARSMGAVPWLVHVHSHPSSPSELFGALDGTWIEEEMQILREKLAEQAQRTGLTALPGFGPGQLYPTLGSTDEEIVKLARQVQADLIVLGAVEGHALRRMLLGSTADGVIRHAPCPVLVVPPGARLQQKAAASQEEALTPVSV
jgi:nucleotide-binding universal stress UspA family protein